jgi:hypothetical protein
MDKRLDFPRYPIQDDYNLKAFLSFNKLNHKDINMQYLTSLLYCINVSPTALLPETKCRYWNELAHTIKPKNVKTLPKSYPSMWTQEILKVRLSTCDGL